MHSLEQRRICDKYGADFDLPVPGTRIGVASNVKSSLIPINGLRHPPYANMCGWFIWATETFPVDNHAFVPLHWSHLPEWNPLAIKYLGLPPGWRFLTDGIYEDVWFDPSLLEVDDADE